MLALCHHQLHALGEKADSVMLALCYQYKQIQKLRNVITIIFKFRTSDEPSSLVNAKM